MKRDRSFEAETKVWTTPNIWFGINTLGPCPKMSVFVGNSEPVTCPTRQMKQGWIFATNKVS